MHSQNQDGYARGNRKDLAGRFQAVEVGHSDVEQNDVGLGDGGKINRLPSVFRLGTYFPASVALEYCPDAAPSHFMIICNQDAKHFPPPQEFNKFWPVFDFAESTSTPFAKLPFLCR